MWRVGTSLLWPLQINNLKLKEHGFFVKLMTTGGPKALIQRRKMRLYSHFANNIAKIWCRNKTSC